MVDFLGVTDHGQQRKGGFDYHAVIPCSLFAEFDVVRHAVGTAKAPLGQDHSLTIVFFKEVQEILVSVVHFVPNPATHLTAAIENPTQFDAHTPAPFVAAFRPKLLLGAALTNGKNQFYRVAVHDIQQTGLLQQQIGQRLMYPQLPQQIGAIWQASKQLLKVAFEPAIKGAKASTLECKQDTCRHDFTRIQLGTGFFCNRPQPVIDLIENVNDNIFRSHEVCLPVSFDNYSLARFMTISTRTIG